MFLASELLPSVIHCDDMGPVVGMFYNEPIRSWDRNATRMRDDRDTRMIVLLSSGPGILTEGATPLPGEVVCKDNVIRRSTTAEAIGPSYYAGEMTDIEGRRVTIDEARKLASNGACNILWRPDGNCGPEAYALVID